MAGSEFATACGSPASVSDHVLTKQNYTKIEHVKTGFFISSFARIQTVLI